MKKTEWFNDDEFWNEYAPVMFDEKRWSEVSAVADGVTRYANLNLYGEEGSKKGKKTSGKPSDGKKPSGINVVDLCCGFGRITLELAKRGFIATGVDITESYLNTAIEDAANEKQKIEYIKQDVRSFKRKDAFNLAVNLYNSFGYFENPDDDLLFLKNAHYSLCEGGTLIIELLGKEIAVRDFNEAEWFERAGYMVLTETNPMDSWASVWNRWILIKNNKHWEKEFVQRLYSASELRKLFFSAGFTHVEIYGNWEEAPYNHLAETLIVVGRKIPAGKQQSNPKSTGNKKA